jgi:hypothetical protein
MPDLLSNPTPQERKRDRSRIILTRAYKALEITAEEVAAAPRATPFLKKIGGIDVAIAALESSPAPEARAFMATYQLASTFPMTARSQLSFEAYCVAAHVCPSRMTAIGVASLAKEHVLEGAIIAALAHPTIMRRNTEEAATPEGIDDRLAHLKMVGAMPLPRSSQTVVNVSATASSASASKADSVAIPAPEDTIRRMVEARQQAAQLSAARQQALPAAPELPSPAFQPRKSVTIDSETED